MDMRRRTWNVAWITPYRIRGTALGVHRDIAVGYARVEHRQGLHVAGWLAKDERLGVVHLLRDSFPMLNWGFGLKPASADIKRLQCMSIHVLVTFAQTGFYCDSLEVIDQVFV